MKTLILAIATSALPVCAWGGRHGPDGLGPPR